jgi:hypothetical protein
LLLVVVPHIAAAEDTASVPDLTVTIRIEIGDRAELDVLTRLVSIENVRGHEVWAIATPRQLEDLRAAGWSWQGAPVMGRATEPGMCAEGWVDDGNRSWTCYPSYQQYEARARGAPDLDHARRRNNRLHTHSASGRSPHKGIWQ